MASVSGINIQLTRTNGLTVSLGDLHKKISSDSFRVLVVGAGGIGCELLKNLVMLGFKHIHVIDMDTIEKTNLNRQFLFCFHEGEVVNGFKAKIAAAEASKLNSDVKITYETDSIFNTPPYAFRHYNIVFGALDNVKARQYVNQCCMANDVPLIDGGTTGMVGQCAVYKKGFKCFDCTEHPAPKVYPYCTIRQTPSEFVHCVVWAKHVFSSLFEEDTTNTSVSLQEDETNHYSSLRSKRASAADLIKKLFVADLEDVLLAVQHKIDCKKPSVLPECRNSNEFSTPEVTDDFKEWNVTLCLDIFNSTLASLNAKGDKVVFDKDNNEVMDFITASARLRALSFGISPRNRFGVKELAGRIIPAIVTSNAIVASIMCLQAFETLQQKPPRQVDLSKFPTGGGRLISPFLPYSTSCAHCCPKYFTIRGNTKSSTIADLVGLVESELKIQEPILVTSTTINNDATKDQPISAIVSVSDFIQVLDMDLLLESKYPHAWLNLIHDESVPKLVLH